MAKRFNCHVMMATLVESKNTYDTKIPIKLKQTIKSKVQYNEN